MCGWHVSMHSCCTWGSSKEGVWFANGYCLSLFLTDRACCITVEDGGSLNAVYYYLSSLGNPALSPERGFAVALMTGYYIWGTNCTSGNLCMNLTSSDTYLPVFRR